MPKKEVGPLENFQKESAAFKKKTEKILTECKDVVKKPPKDKTRLETTLHKCTSSLEEAEVMLARANDLKPENEPVPVAKFDEKKKVEVTQLQSIKERLDAVEVQLAELAGVKSVKTNQAEISAVPEVVEASNHEDEYDEEEGEDDEDEEEDDEEDGEEEEAEDDEEDGEEEDDDEGADDDDDEVSEEEEEGEEEEDEEEQAAAVHHKHNMPQHLKSAGDKKYVALDEFHGEQEGDLAFVKGEILTVLIERSDGWMVAQNAQGKKGLVPINFLQIVESDHNDSVDDHNDEDEDDGDDDEDEDAEEESVDEDAAEQSSPRTGKGLWNDVKQVVQDASVAGAVEALSGLPAGCCEPSLAKMKLKDEYNFSVCLSPKLAPSSLYFKDLSIDSNSVDKVRFVEAPIQRIITIVSGQQMPLLGNGIEVTSRHIRVCLFDGQRVQSNIIVCRVSQVDKDQKTWMFSTKQESKCLELADFAIRSNATNTNLGVLIEVCQTYKRSSGHEFEISCGYVFLKLFDQKGAAAVNKTYEEELLDGSPFTKGPNAALSPGRKEKSSLFRSMISTNKQARLTLRLSAPTKEQKDNLDTLPCSIMCSTAYIQYIAFYRQLLVDKLVRYRTDIGSTEPIHCPVLSTLPAILEQPDTMDVLRTAWTEKLKSAKRSDKKDVDTLTSMFKQVFMDSVFPVFNVAYLDTFDIARIQQNRATEIQRVVQINKKSPGACFFTSDVQHKPFDVSELSFHVARPQHSIDIGA